MNQQIDKPTMNEEFRICDFSNVLDSSDSIVGQTITITDNLGVDCTATMISDTSIHIGSKSVRYKLKGGVEQGRYELSILITTASTQRFVEPFTVCIS
jgi:hypothetical protein